jgi:hypothetical protein
VVLVPLVDGLARGVEPLRRVALGPAADRDDRQSQIVSA